MHKTDKYHTIIQIKAVSLYYNIKTKDMKITKTKALQFIQAAKKQKPSIKGMRCEIQERVPLGDRNPADCHVLNDTDYFDSGDCDAASAKWILDQIYTGKHPDIISLAFYRFDGIWNGSPDYELYDHLWIENAKEQFEKFLEGDKFETQTT